MRNIAFSRCLRICVCIYIDLEIAVDGEMDLNSAHGIAQSVHDRIEKEIPKVKHCMVHVNPAKKGRQPQ